MKIFIRLLKCFTFLFILFLCFQIGLYGYCYFTPKLEINKNQSYYLYDKDKNLLFDNNNDWIELSRISPYLIHATIDTEDKNFYQHLGFDYLRIIKAIFRNLKSRSFKEGASTITTMVEYMV